MSEGEHCFSFYPLWFRPDGMFNFNFFGKESSTFLLEVEVKVVCEHSRVTRFGKSIFLPFDFSGISCFLPYISLLKSIIFHVSCLSRLPAAGVPLTYSSALSLTTPTFILSEVVKLPFPLIGGPSSLKKIISLLSANRT